jgi:hypothetical protein
MKKPKFDMEAAAFAALIVVALGYLIGRIIVGLINKLGY